MGCMWYDRGDSFPFDFEPNGVPFVSKSKGKLSPWSYPIQCERKWKHNFLSVGGRECVTVYTHVQKKNKKNNLYWYYISAVSTIGQYEKKNIFSKIECNQIFDNIQHLFVSWNNVHKVMLME